jgi:hypothetical protein
MTKKELAALQDQLNQLIKAMNNDLIEEISKRIKATDNITPDSVLDWQVRKLAEMGELRRGAVNLMKFSTGKTFDTLQQMIEGVGLSIVDSFSSDYEEAFAEGLLKMLPVSRSASPAVKQIMQAAVNNMRSTLNLVNTTALESVNKNFMNILNQVSLETSLGIRDYNTSVKLAMQKLAKEGITGMTYTSASGRTRSDRIDVAVRRATLTTMSQMAANVQLQRASEYGSNYVEVSSHFPCRPTHAKWQGKVYMIKGSSPEYPNLAEATGYGSVGGLCGANCGHNFYPFFPGLSERRFKQYDEEANRKAYGVSQKQRSLERDIREAKRDAMNATDDASRAAANKRIKDGQAKMRGFIDSTGRTRRRNREQELDVRHLLPEKKKERVKVEKELFGADGSRNWSAEAKRRMAADERSILNMGGNKERAFVYNSKGERIMDVEGLDNAVEYTDQQLAAMRGMIHTHNHPSGRSFSLPDLYFMEETRIAEARATTDFGTYVMRYPPKWPAKWKTMQGGGLQEDVFNHQQKNMKKYKEQLEAVADDADALARLKIKIHNETIEEVLHKRGFEYFFEPWE